jgi:hypothetical protein
MSFYSTTEDYEHSTDAEYQQPTMINCTIPQENSISTSIVSPSSFVSVSSYGSTGAGISGIATATNEHTSMLSSNRNGSAPHQEQPLTRKPKRMLTAYNFFFHHHRQLILAGSPEAGNAAGKSHGKIGFKALAQLISARWKAITVEEKANFQACSDKDKIRHSEEIKIWKKQQEEEAACLRQQEELKQAQDCAPLLTFFDENLSSQHDPNRHAAAIACVDMSPQESQRLALALGQDEVNFLARAFC